MPRTVCTRPLGAQQQVDRCQEPLSPPVLLQHLAEAQDDALVTLPVIPAAQAALLHGLNRLRHSGRRRFKQTFAGAMTKCHGAQKTIKAMDQFNSGGS